MNKPQKDEKFGVLGHTEGPFERPEVCLSQTRGPLSKLEGCAFIHAASAEDGEVAILKIFAVVSCTKRSEISKIQ